ncbi:MAG: hypothetical protein ABI391_01920 [Hyphomicrobiaceae bacterium]
MAYAGMKASITAALAAATLALAGCLEISQDAAFRENGEVRFESEVALAPEITALMSNPIFTKQMGEQGVPDLLGECGKPWPADKPMPAGVRSIESRRGKRGDMDTCTWTADVSAPIDAVESVKAMKPPSRHKLPEQEFSLARLEGRPGYRLRIAITPLKLPPTPGDTQNLGKAVLDAMFVNRHITLSLSGQRIENTNGALAPDGRRVTWRIPIATAIDPTRQTPLTIEADILYR